MLKKICLIAVGMLFFAHPVWAISFEELWKKSLPVMETGLDVLASGKAKDERGVLDVMTGRKSEFQRIVAKTFEVLSVSDVQKKMDVVVDARKEIAAKKLKISQYRKASLAAPQESMNPLTDTKDSLKKDIASAEAAIKEYEQQIEHVTEDIRKDITKNNPGISQDQIDSLILSIDGEEQITIFGMAENIKLMQAQIEESLQAGNTSIEIVKTYSGIFMMINEAYAYAYADTAAKIQDTYLKKLEGIVAESKKLHAEAQQLFAGADPAQKNNLRANIESNEMTLLVCGKYKTYLQNQLAYLKETKAKVDNNVKIATNTYNTIRNSNQLITLMNTSTDTIKALLSFKMPEFAVLHDTTLRREFGAITARLQLE